MKTDSEDWSDQHARRAMWEDFFHRRCPTKRDVINSAVSALVLREAECAELRERLSECETALSEAEAQRERDRLRNVARFADALLRAMRRLRVHEITDLDIAEICGELPPAEVAEWAPEGDPEDDAAESYTVARALHAALNGEAMEAADAARGEVTP